MSEDLARRVQALEDRWEISELVAQYGRAVDDRDFDTLGEMYTADAVFDSVGEPATGRRSVVDYYRARTAAYGATYHYPHSNEIELVDLDRARGVVCAHAELAVGDESVFVALRYLDDYRREDGRWRFHERVVRLLYVLPLSELTRGFAERRRVRWPGAEPAEPHLGADLD
jgi:ketosteroid isomerase-like protein